MPSLLFFLLLQTIFGLSWASLCPEPEDIEPCYCVSDGKNIRIDCMQVDSVEDLKRGLKSLVGTRQLFFDFLRTRLHKIPSDLFEGLHVTKLSFSQCDFQQFGDEGRSALEGLEDSIEELSFQFSFTEPNELRYLNVSRLKVLRELEIEGNDMNELGNEWFQEGPLSLQNLFIMSNLIQELGSEAFTSLKNLKNLWLTGNRFKTLNRSMLPNPALQLTSLDLTKNEISSIPKDMFVNMPSLKEVILAENYIQTLPERTWSTIWSQLTRVYLENNPLKCEEIDWMFELARPFVLKGRCVSPVERKDVELKRIIDDKKWEEDFGDLS